MIPYQSNNHIWSIIMGGGQGEQSYPFIEQWLGYPLPKQYCTFVGTRSMLQHTFDRAACLSPKDQILIVVGQTNGHPAWADLEGQLAGQVVLQPNNCTTGPGVFLPLTYVLKRDPNATVVICPADHYVFPEERFVETLQVAVQHAEMMKDRILVFGAPPTYLELRYGWLEKGPPIGWKTGPRVYELKAFIEKPDEVQGLNAMTRGALWNTSVTVAKAKTLWHLGWNCFPNLMDRFARLREAIGTPRESQTLMTITQDIPICNFTGDFLERIPHCIGVMELEGVQWSDWGMPERIVETLRLVGKVPAFSTNQLNMRRVTPYSKSQIEVQ